MSHPHERFDIGTAVRLLQKGRHVARAGWNGKGMYLAYQPGSEVATGNPLGEVRKLLPYVVLHTVDESCVPWTCSQIDLLATDWCEVP